MKKTETKNLVLKKETLRDLTVHNQEQVKGGGKSKGGRTKKCITISC